MNEYHPPGRESDVPWPASESRTPVPDTSMLPGSERAPPATVRLMENAVQGAHDTIDRLADRAAPAVRQLGDSVAAAEVARHARADAMRDTRDAWVEGLRTTVRDNPLACVAAALALGALVVRVTR